MAFNAYEFYSEKLIYINGKGIGIGDSEEKLKEEFGEPDKIYVSEYNSNRYVYLLENGYLFAGINENGEIEEIFTNCNDFEYYNYSPDTDIFEFKHEDPHIGTAVQLRQRLVNRIIVNAIGTR